MDKAHMKLAKLVPFLFIVALFVAGAARAGVPAIPEIPTTLPDSVREPLIAKRQPLALRKLALIDEGKTINRRCAKVATGSAQHQACVTRRARFNTTADTLSSEVDKLEDDIDAAIEAEKRRVAAPNKDATVVDARVPRDGAYMLRRVPELARSPAADRIMKGFQAVINRDWPVALMWWQDALRRDPANAALKRSVDLAQWMVDRGKTAAAGPVTPPLAAAIHAAARGENAEAIRQFEIVKVQNPAVAPHADRMIAAIRQKSEQAVKDATLNWRIEKQQRDIVEGLFDTGLKRLSIGDEKGAQEAFRDADFFSMGLPTNQLPYQSPPSARP